MTEAIRIDDLSYCYPDGQHALKGIDLVIQEGESIALIGPNGAGKSTLLQHLNGILRSTRVHILGRAIDDQSLPWVRGRVGLIFQNPDDQLFSPTVFDDVAFGPLNMGQTEEETKQLVVESLEMVGMAGYESRSPHHLSIGEKKRIAIASVLAMGPAILAIDEPTANLDPRSKWSLVDLLRKLALTQIIATHDLEMVQALCPRTIILDGGQIIKDGATDRILADRDLLEAHGLARSPGAIDYEMNLAPAPD